MKPFTDKGVKETLMILKDPLDPTEPPLTEEERRSFMVLVKRLHFMSGRDFLRSVVNWNTMLLVLAVLLVWVATATEHWVIQFAAGLSVCAFTNSLVDAVVFFRRLNVQSCIMFYLSKFFVPHDDPDRDQPGVRNDATRRLLKISRHLEF